MNAIHVWGLLTLLLCLSVPGLRGESAVGEADAGDRPEASLSPSDFRLRGLSMPGEDRVAAAYDRNPFEFAPVQVPRGRADSPNANTAGTGDDGFPLITLEGILLRSARREAFIRYRGERRALSAGEQIVEGVFVQAVDKKSIVVTNRWGESRRLYLVQ